MAQSLSRKLNTFASLSGVIGPAIMGLGMLLSALAYVGVDGQRFNLANHFVSELGELGVSQWADVFNVSLILGGIFTTVFMGYLAFQLDHWLRYPLGLLSVYTTINGALVGVFPMNFLEPHTRVAMSFFNLGMLMSFLYSLFFLFSSKHPFPRWMAVPGLLNAASFALFLNFPGGFEGDTGFDDGMAGLFTNRPDFIPLALLEWVVILGILLWVLLLGAYSFQKEIRKRSSAA
jgi:hypothetical membrane protein